MVQSVSLQSGCVPLAASVDSGELQDVTCFDCLDDILIVLVRVALRAQHGYNEHTEADQF